MDNIPVGSVHVLVVIADVDVGDGVVAVYLPTANTEGGAAGYNRGGAPRHRGAPLQSSGASPQRGSSAS